MSVLDAIVAAAKAMGLGPETLQEAAEKGIDLLAMAAKSWVKVHVVQVTTTGKAGIRVRD